jgi:hypothetical protein
MTFSLQAILHFRECAFAEGKRRPVRRSDLDEENQGNLYRLLKESQISYISVGHRTTLIQYHNRLLTLDRSGSWEIEAAGIS